MHNFGPFDLEWAAFKDGRTSHLCYQYFTEALVTYSIMPMATVEFSWDCFKSKAWLSSEFHSSKTAAGEIVVAYTPTIHLIYEYYWRRKPREAHAMERFNVGVRPVWHSCEMRTSDYFVEENDADDSLTCTTCETKICRTHVRGYYVASWQGAEGRLLLHPPTMAQDWTLWAHLWRLSPFEELLYRNCVQDSFLPLLRTMAPQVKELAKASALQNKFSLAMPS